MSSRDSIEEDELDPPFNLDENTHSNVKVCYLAEWTKSEDAGQEQLPSQIDCDFPHFGHPRALGIFEPLSWRASAMNIPEPSSEAARYPWFTIEINLSS